MNSCKQHESFLSCIVIRPRKVMSDQEICGDTAESPKNCNRIPWFFSVFCGWTDNFRIFFKKTATFLDEISVCSRQFSLFSSFVFSCMSSSVVCCTAVSLCSVCQIPHLPTSVVQHIDRQDGYGCFGSRIESVCHKTYFFILFCLKKKVRFFLHFSNFFFSSRCQVTPAVIFSFFHFFSRPSRRQNQTVFHFFVVTVS